MENLNWEEEATAIIKDISSCVSSAELSGLNRNEHFDARIAFLNIETREGRRLTVKLDTEGFSVVGRDFDNNSLDSQEIFKYETIYALLSHESPAYTSTFAQTLTDKLTQLANENSTPENTRKEQ